MFVEHHLVGNRESWTQSVTNGLTSTNGLDVRALVRRSSSQRVPTFTREPIAGGVFRSKNGGEHMELR